MGNNAALVLDVKRVLALLCVTLKYGFPPLLRRLLGRPPKGLSTGQRLRLAFEELGITYLKLGQFLTMRFDILPMEICAELNRLFETVPPMEFETTRTVVESELHAAPEQLFRSFDWSPIAAASVAQVHVAYTRAGEKVAVKVQRAGIAHLFAADMRNLRRIGRIIDALGIAGGFSATEVTNQFASWTEHEMDFEMEARTSERIRQNAASYEIIPKVHWSLTTKRVLTMEFVEGVSLAKIAAMIDAGRANQLAQMLPNLNVERAGRNIAFAVLRQFFVFGFFQGDPHPGNVLIRDDNTVAFVDFGIFGQLTEAQRENFAGFLENLALGNIEQSFRYYTRQHTPTAETNLRAFETQAKRILRLWYETSVSPFATAKQRHMGRYAVWMIEAIRRHRLRTDPNVLLLWRALYVLDASSERLSEYFDMMAQVRAFFLEFRPGPLGRVAKMLVDPERNAALLRLARQAPEYAEIFWSNVAGAEPRLAVLGEESASSHRAESRETRWLALGMVALSLVALAQSPHVGVPFKFGAAIVLAAGSLLARRLP
jgi:ubiquinone biosynthesis protein